MIGQMAKTSLAIIVFWVGLPILLLEMLFRVTPVSVWAHHEGLEDVRPLPGHDVHPMTFDPRLGWRPTPGARSQLWGREHPVNILQSGLRSNGPSSLQDSEATLLAVGDSFTFGDGVGNSETWPAYLEKMLGNRVLNGGVSSYGFDQTVLRAERLVKDLQPDMLIVSLIEDDIARTEFSTRFYAPKPFFVRTKHGIVLDDAPLTRWNSIPRTTAPNWLKELSEWSVLANFATTTVFPYLAMNLDAYYLRREHNMGQEIACFLMGRLALLSQTNSMPILILVQYGDELEKKDILESVLQCAVDEGLATVDPYDELVSLEERSTDEFSSLFAGHMSASGNRFIANFVYQYLLTSKHRNLIASE